MVYFDIFCECQKKIKNIKILANLNFSQNNTFHSDIRDKSKKKKCVRV